MDRFTRKQEKIERQAAEIVVAYPSLWVKMIEAWCQPDSEDRVWLMYSANYLFRTSNVRWAIDPLRLRHRLPAAPEMQATDLKELSFVLLTHSHGDHLDLDLLRQLWEYPILWVIPAPVLEFVGAELTLPKDRMIVPRAMQSIEIQGICITPFDGLHWESQSGSGAVRGVPATGYLIEYNGKRWLFPGDSRTFDSSQLPFGELLDGLFAHLWLGRSSALMKTPPLLDEFCRFLVDSQPRKVILTHLCEFGRDANDFWDRGHAQKVSAWFRENATTVSLHPVCTGESILI